MPEKAFSSYPATLGTKRVLLSLGLQTNGFITWIANKWCCQVEGKFWTFTYKQGWGQLLVIIEIPK